MRDILISIFLVVLCSLVLAGCGDEPINYDVSDEEVTQYEGYTLLWHDEFNGTELDKSNWFPEYHTPGWVNNELQEYTVNGDNYYVKDGKLVIKATKTTDENGKDHYASARISSQSRQEFTYGKVIVNAKVPKGKGLWPAAWMLPASTKQYGQWPVSGEIDIMEILCHETNKSYSTIHFGLPHKQSGGFYFTHRDEPDFSEDFHEFSVDWEPGEMRFYVDGNPVYTVKKWFGANVRQLPYPFPAPFDADFYVILNLAVGGDWPGVPNASTDFDNAEFLIDYVRVYQKSE